MPCSLIPYENPIERPQLSLYTYIKKFFVCVGVMYSGEYVCDVTLSVHPHRAS